MNKMIFLIVVLMLLPSCQSSYGGGDYARTSLPRVTIISYPGGDNVVFRIYSDKSLQTLIRESRGPGMVEVEIPEGKYYFTAWKDENGNNTIDSGDLYGVDTTGRNITYGYNHIEITLSPITGR